MADSGDLCITEDDAYEPGTIAHHDGSQDLIALHVKIKAQKSISNTSDDAHAKVITTGEPTTPSLLITALPSIDDLIAGDSHAHDLLRAQPATSQCILCKSVDLDDPPF